MSARTPGEAPHHAAYHVLRAFLINYRFRPGEQLHPARIADALSMSSTPVRELFHRMSAEKLLTIIPGRGFFANILSEREMRELLGLIYLLLTHVVQTRNATQAPRLVNPASLETLLSNPVTRSRGGELADDIETVLTATAELSGNSTIVDAIRSWSDRTHYVRCLQVEDEDRAVEMIRQLHDFLRCMGMKDKKGATSRLNAQLRASLLRLNAVVREGIIRCHTQSSDQVLSELKREATGPRNLVQHPSRRLL
jgi:DNA-binding GntR family transcriptional regulator